ncbi:hypothetical protein [Saccharopolyspora phatthalungensis]|uniref:Uncharacterized protein n=1 Tax=Saccharopolyspora phatthalungensis TaxID=664693 RepID=A0A840QDI3_9PSEU|nr:hypothetical protein [Saccharopolyspora phatthalungensis]MBB5158834.1 hypothetical protein [Saccharopolyspora phatthalungensis]
MDPITFAALRGLDTLAYRVGTASPRRWPRRSRKSGVDDLGIDSENDSSVRWLIAGSGRGG